MGWQQGIKRMWGISRVRGFNIGLWSLIACLVIIGAGCSHVSRDELATDLDSVRAELRAEQQDSADRLDGRIDDMDRRVDGRLDDLELSQMETAARLARLELAFAELESQFAITVTHFEKAIAFNVPLHFDFDSTSLDDSQTGTLDHFADFYAEFYRGDLITVEGFTDEAGSEEYNHRLGKRRAEEVKSYLTEIGGLDPQMLRTISYGESYTRLVAPGEYGEAAGRDNRRVVLVIDQSAHAAGSAAISPGEDDEGSRRDEQS
jgi:outer membrane protein OmpA-like peptidoglycan-associated protein